MMTKTQKSLKKQVGKTPKKPYQGKKNIKVNEKSFIKDAMSSAKSFMKDTLGKVKKNAKDVMRYIKQNFGGAKKPENFQPGHLLSFSYNAKFKEHTYDKHPLVISLGYSQNPKHRRTHFYGLNIHHLPMQDRVKIASFFVELNKKRKGQIQYQDVKPFMKMFKGHKVLRQYIIKRVSNKIYDIDEEMYLSMASLPSEEIIKGLK